MPNANELKQLSRQRLDEARALLTAECWPGAYYLSGYALECALKVCVLSYIDRTGIIFEDRKYAEKCFTHHLANLVSLADLDAERGAEIAHNPKFGMTWTIAKDWTEASRYQLWTQPEAETMVDAIGDPSDGVLPWIMKHW